MEPTLSTWPSSWILPKASVHHSDLPPPCLTGRESHNWKSLAKSGHSFSCCYLAPFLSGCLYCDRRNKKVAAEAYGIMRIHPSKKWFGDEVWGLRLVFHFLPLCCWSQANREEHKEKGVQLPWTEWLGLSLKTRAEASGCPLSQDWVSGAGSTLSWLSPLQGPAPVMRPGMRWFF